jgi:hypothetical protein
MPKIANSRYQCIKFAVLLLSISLNCHEGAASVVDPDPNP